MLDYFKEVVDINNLLRVNLVFTIFMIVFSVILLNSKIYGPTIKYLIVAALIITFLVIIELKGATKFEPNYRSLNYLTAIYLVFSVVYGSYLSFNLGRHFIHLISQK